jgi:hypothetical protein
MKRVFVALLNGGLLAVFTLTPALAAPNPSGTGQPGAECGEPGATVEPPGFLKDGFAHAETVYAGSEGTPSAANGSVQAFTVRRRLLSSDLESVVEGTPVRPPFARSGCLPPLH